jgi:hypothetical protein
MSTSGTGWLGRTLLRGLALCAGVTLLLRLSWWQWERGRASGRLLHYTYAVEWLLVAVALVGLLLVRRRPRSRPDLGGSLDVTGRVIGPPLRAGERLTPTTREQVLGRLRPGAPPPRSS